MPSKPPAARAPEYAQPPAAVAPRPPTLGAAAPRCAPCDPGAADGGAAAVVRGAVTRMPTAHGLFDAVCYAEPASGVEHIALLAGDVCPGAAADRARIPRPARDRAAAAAPATDPRRLAPLVRVHSECATGDIFGSRRCDCGEQLQRSLELVRASGGVLLYLRGHEGRGIGLGAKLRAYALQDRGRDTIEANADQGLPVEARTYGAAAAMLRDLGVDAVRLLTNNPAKCDALAAFGIAVAARVPLVTTPNEDNVAYLRTKQARMGHDLGLPEAP
jgi:3,4-dihydroxy 2-butanone 4-phosphate synthase/GTP cyclohydrolase II